MADGFKPLLAKLVDGRVLSAAEAHDFFAACLRGEPTPAQVAAAVTALRIRGETVDEIAAFAGAMREAALAVGGELQAGRLSLQPQTPVSVGFILTDENVASVQIQILDAETDGVLWASDTEIPVKLGL